MRHPSVLVSLALGLAVLTLSVPGSADPPTQAESEPNGDAGTADPLPGPACFVTGTGAISPVGDEDYWSFPGTAGASVWAFVDTGGPQNPDGDSRHAGLRIFHPNGTGTIERDIGDGTGNGGDSSIETDQSPAIAGATLASSGTHFVRPVEAGDNAVIDPYRLFLATATLTTATLEPNDTTAEATPINRCPDVRSGSISTGTDADLYAVNVAPGEVLFVALDGDPERDGAGPDLVVDLLAPNGSDTLLTADSSAVTVPGNPAQEGDPAAEAFSFNIDEGGIYFVRVRPADPAQTGTYRLMVAGGIGTGAEKKDTCAGRAATHIGTPGDDVLVGTGADETFLGLGGNDRITGGGGNDTICGGPGKDTIRGKSGKDRLFGEGGRDTIKGGGGKDLLKGGPGKDRLAGQGGNDNLRGQGGSDRLNGGPGKDRCVQGAGKGPEISCER
jgi:Ca2+-binding RTX toxin-like protein